ncbi:MAG: Gfo/Idh/MocA family oxidoreductase [Acidobacteriota bacterium]|nr:Gfo/Idh/MocA family oxidoreductase [Acidobacteriota bacterium]
MAETDKKEIRFGLIGCGGVGISRADALYRCARTKLGAVSDLDRTRAASVAERCGAHIVDSWTDLITRGDIDAVVVSTPPRLHSEMCIAALRAGKDVLCEKPLARTVEEGREILKAADESGRFLATGYNFRFFPSVLKTRELLDSGLIGELDHIRSYAGYSASEHPYEWLHDAEAMGGGALRDNGTHLIDLTRYLLGEIEDVQGFVSNRVWNFAGCEDNGMAVLRGSGGQLASLHASWTEWRGYRFLLETYGSKGCIKTSIFPMITKVLWSAQRASKPQKRSFYFPMTHVMEHLRSYKWVGVQSFVLELHAFCDALSGKKTSIATGFDGLRAIEIADAVAGNVPLIPLGRTARL